MSYKAGVNSDIDRGVALVDMNDPKQVQKLDWWMKYDETEEGLRKFVPTFHKHEPKQMTYDILGTVTGDPEEVAQFLKEADEYFHSFSAATIIEKRTKCFHCGTDLAGMFGSFTWGLAYGEGRCGKCGWPARVHHTAVSKDGEELFTLKNYVLQYMPKVAT